MAANHPKHPTFCTARRAHFFSGSSSVGQTVHNIITAKISRKRCVKATIGYGTKLSAWTNVRREHWEGDLAVEGHLPAWLSGTYLRNGPGLWDVGEHSFHHIFDGYATLLCPRKPGSLLDRLRNVIGLSSGAMLSDNANISVFPLGDGRVICLTETTKSSVLIDPETLDTIGKFPYADRLWCPLQSTHPVVTRNEFLTLLPDLFRRGHRIVRMAAGSNERKVLARVHCRGGMAPGWVHSFAVTENYIVVPEMPLRYSITAVLTAEMPLRGRRLTSFLGNNEEITVCVARLIRP
ncbi:carotenoid cleavage dioxygenase 8 homolog A, chloroplastic-like [Panicum virgatum]|uniref:carotenoid cleavage dioxygenase 8 homolog A, chloroplastic-like n=1 Tax=Panicum virgatum TaxID=38727 RepID=UPI0019D54B76|nr:carotenoid cleavage dioxygenase 8 homolog A, chloroplastic-like [Panicum virgatum]